MKKFKKMFPFVLIAAMLLLATTACNGTETPIDPEPPEAEPPQIELRPTEPPEAEPPTTDNGQNGDEITIQPLPGEIDDPNESEISIDLITIDDANIVYEEWPPVMVDGEGVQGSSHQIVGDEVFPNYVSLVIVARALGSQVGIEGNEIVLDGLDGRISFEIDSTDFTVNIRGEDRIVTLRHPALVIDNVLYVPVEFFREVFGAGEAFFSGGEIHINTEPGDMH